MSASNPAPPKLDPLKIEIILAKGKTFKSLASLTWSDVPPLAILTGRNGTGKTQLLELMGYRLTETRLSSVPEADQIQVKVSDPEIVPATVAFLPSTWTIDSGGAMSIADLKQRKEQLWNQVRQNHNQHDMRQQGLRRRVLKALKRSNVDALSQEDFYKQLPDDFAYMLDESEISEGLVHVFMGYRFKLLEALEAGTSRDKVQEKLGPAPWVVMNDVLKTADFPYEVISPEGVPLLDLYQLLLLDRITGVKLSPSDLSSGEKMLLRVVTWLYGSQRHARFPKLLLLDEPDAHLHPSMTRLFLQVLKDVLVEKYGVRVIMSTHSPSTVALAPEGSVFEMAKTEPRIRPASKLSAIGLLTAGLVTVAPGSRFVLVEDESDVTFYGAIRDLLTDYGPSKDPMALAPAPTIAFLPASVGKSKEKVAGGKSIVAEWIGKLDQSPLTEIFRGIIDLDGGNSATARISVLGRYSYENYLVDPFIIYAHLLGMNRAPAITGLTISAGEEYRIRSLPVPQLVQILEAVAVPVEAKLGSVDKSKVRVKFTNGVEIDYPKWMLASRGHDLLPIYQETYGTAGSFSPPLLIQTMRRVRLLPQELADILRAIPST